MENYGAAVSSDLESNFPLLILFPEVAANGLGFLCEVGVVLGQLRANYRADGAVAVAEVDLFGEGENLSRLPLRRIIENAERSAIMSAMRIHKTTRLAAKALGVSQATIVQKMKRWERSD